MYTNIHAIDEFNLEVMIDSFTSLLYSDSHVEKALERYMKAKGVKVKNQNLMVATMRHCHLFRLRNAHILNACSEYFISNCKTIEPRHFKTLFTPFGFMDYEPLNSKKFWQTIEQYLESKFIKIHPTDIIDIMLCCIYLNKYPLNFINRIFNPYFLDALHTKSKPEHLSKIRSDLKLFDTALTLECASYDGPLLPKDHSAKSIWMDGRIKRIVNMISDEIANVAGGYNRFTKFTSLPNLPINELYIVDILLHPVGMGNMFAINVNRERNINVAMLINLPEHYSDSKITVSTPSRGDSKRF
jgi:Xaa-Pro dipeptidase